MVTKRYRHFKGNTYLLVGVFGTDYIYQSEFDGKLYSRDIYEFNDIHPEKKVKRFEELSSAEIDMVSLDGKPVYNSSSLEIDYYIKYNPKGDFVYVVNPKEFESKYIK